MKQQLSYMKRILQLLIVAIVLLILIPVSLIVLIYNEKNAVPSHIETAILPRSQPIISSDKMKTIITEPEILAQGEGVEIVVAQCTSCHSPRLIAQNRATREGWLGMIRWMQETQNLWDLGENEAVILDYLEKNYPPEVNGRRENLKDIEWYVLE